MYRCCELLAKDVALNTYTCRALSGFWERGSTDYPRVGARQSMSPDCWQHHQRQKTGLPLIVQPLSARLNASLLCVPIQEISLYLRSYRPGIGCRFPGYFGRGSSSHWIFAMSPSVPGCWLRVCGWNRSAKERQTKNAIKDTMALALLIALLDLLHQVCNVFDPMNVARSDGLAILSSVLTCLSSALAAASVARPKRGC